MSTAATSPSSFLPAMNLNYRTEVPSFPISFISGQWEWIILPVVLGGIILLLLTMVQTKRKTMPLQKASVLAFLYHGLENRLKDGPAITTASGMDMNARKVRVRLRPSCPLHP
jgi:hypothetical protein